MKNLRIPIWHVLYVKHRHERKIQEALQKKKIEVFLPLVESLRMWSDRKKKIINPLFPRYVFVKITSKRDLHEALTVEGVLKYLKFGKEYALVRPKEIDQIKQLLNIDSLSDIKATGYLPRIGQKMKITYGSLSGLECEVIKVNKIQKILVRIESIQFNVTACVPSIYLTALKNEALVSAST